MPLPKRLTGLAAQQWVRQIVYFASLNRPLSLSPGTSGVRASDTYLYSSIFDILFLGVEGLALRDSYIGSRRNICRYTIYSLKHASWFHFYGSLTYATSRLRFCYHAREYNTMAESNARHLLMAPMDGSRSVKQSDLLVAHFYLDTSRHAASRRQGAALRLVITYFDNSKQSPRTRAYFAAVTPVLISRNKRHCVTLLSSITYRRRRRDRFDPSLVPCAADKICACSKLLSILAFEGG